MSNKNHIWNFIMEFILRIFFLISIRPFHRISLISYYVVLYISIFIQWLLNFDKINCWHTFSRQYCVVFWVFTIDFQALLKAIKKIMIKSNKYWVSMKWCIGFSIIALYCTFSHWKIKIIEVDQIKKWTWLKKRTLIQFTKF